MPLDCYIKTMTQNPPIHLSHLGMQRTYQVVVLMPEGGERVVYHARRYEDALFYIKRQAFRLMEKEEEQKEEKTEANEPVLWTEERSRMENAPRRRIYTSDISRLIAKALRAFLEGRNRSEIGVVVDTGPMWKPWPYKIVLTVGEEHFLISVAHIPPYAREGERGEERKEENLPF